LKHMAPYPPYPIMTCGDQSHHDTWHPIILWHMGYHTWHWLSDDMGVDWAMTRKLTRRWHEHWMGSDWAIKIFTKSWTFPRLELHKFLLFHMNDMGIFTIQTLDYQLPQCMWDLKGWI
jgi:hypothetical protein